MDADRFDTLARALQTTSTRRLTLCGLTAVGLAALLGEAEAGKKKKGGKKGGGKKGGKKNKKKKELCLPEGESCTFSLHPCCGDTLCCDPLETGFRTCVPRDQCCAENVICSTPSSSECSASCTCQNRDFHGIGRCLPVV